MAVHLHRGPEEQHRLGVSVKLARREAEKRLRSNSVDKGKLP
jgi:hypothetical protein